jgi:hypothetical protein
VDRPRVAEFRNPAGAFFGEVDPVDRQEMRHGNGESRSHENGKRLWLHEVTNPFAADETLAAGPCTGQRLVGGLANFDNGSMNVS